MDDLATRRFRHHHDQRRRCHGVLRVVAVVASIAVLVVPAFLPAGPVPEVLDYGGEGSCQPLEWTETVASVLDAPAPAKRIDLVAGGFRPALSCVGHHDVYQVQMWPDGVGTAQQVGRQAYDEVRVILEDRVVMIAAPLPAQDHLDLGITFLEDGGFRVMEAGQPVEVLDHTTVMGHAILETWQWTFPSRQLVPGKAEHSVDIPVLTGWNRGLSSYFEVRFTNGFQGNLDEVGDLAGGLAVDLVAPNGTIAQSLFLPPPFENGGIRMAPMEEGTWRIVLHVEGGNYGQWTIVYGGSVTMTY